MNAKITKPKSPKKLEIGGFLKPKTKKLSISVAALDGRRYYPELSAKTCNGAKSPEVSNDSDFFERFLQKNSKRPEPLKGLYRCTRSFLHGTTSQAVFLKMLTCGKDWCPDCGKIGSMSHNRRVAPVLNRLLALLETGQKVGYLVVTVPAQLREAFRDKEVMNDFRTYWRRKLKREGIPMGVMRWHWTGEDGETWKPHLNILAKSGFLKMETLMRWRSELCQYFKNNFGISCAGNLYYHYTDDAGKLAHWTKYVFRATATIYNKRTAAAIKGYRNTSVFGAKSDWPIKFLTSEEKEAAALRGFDLNKETGEVEKIWWSKTWNPDLQKLEVMKIPVAMAENMFSGSERIGAGFYRLARPGLETITRKYERPQRPGSVLFLRASGVCRKNPDDLIFRQYGKTFYLFYQSPPDWLIRWREKQAVPF